ncbi:MAG: TonB-dependent receptor [Caulobacter sp.]|nr:TonB-dependent receptor [Caulobacter sp.]
MRLQRLAVLSGASLLAMSLAAPALAADAPSATAGQDNEVEAVVVTGSPFAVSLDSVTTSVAVVSRDDLDIAPPVGLGDLLSGQPGLRSTFFGPGASRPVIRGLSGPRVLVLQNGVGLVDASSLSPDHAVASDPGEASRIEVLRGPSTLAYGGAGIGGVVNIIDDRIPTRIPDGGVSGRLSVSGSSVDSGQSLSFGLQAASGPVVFAIDGVSRRSDDYDVPGTPVSSRLAAAEGLTPDPARVVRNTDTRLDAYGVGVSFVTDGGFIGLSVKQTDTLYGVPYLQVLAPIDPNAEGPVAIDLHQTRFDFRAEVPFDDGPISKVRASLGYADYEHAEVSRTDGAIGTRFLSHGLESRVELVQRETDILKGAVGFQALNRHFDSLGDEASVPKTDIQEYGVFTLQRIDFGTWGLDGGLRVDHREMNAFLAGRPTGAAAASYGIDWTTAGNSPSFTDVSGSIGVFTKPTDSQFYALTVARSARAPTEAELYSDGPHPGTGAYEIGQPDLKSEAVVSVEATGRWTFDRVRGEAHLWWAGYDGYIEQAPTGDVEADLPVYRYFATGAQFYGFEAEGSYDLWTSGERTLSVDLGADFVHGKLDTGVPARIPPWSATGKLIWESPMYDARVEVHYASEQTRVAANELPTDAYTMVNFYGAVKPFRDPNLRLFIEGRNLTDVVAREHVSFLKDIAPLPGRSVRAGLALRF